MEDGASAAKGVEKTAGGGGASSEIDEDLGEFGGKHACSDIASGAGLVALGIGGDILGTDAECDMFLEGYDFDMIGFFTELVVMRSSRGESGSSIVRDDADRASVALEDRFEFERLGLRGFGGGVSGIVRKAECDFARRKIC